jgi:hypothetical protein
MSAINNKIFRFKLSDDIVSLITQFAKIHQYDDRHTYKDAWQNWFKSQEELLEREILRLNQLGYKGDVQDKMFKAGRYYFREKPQAKKEAVKEEVKKEKRNYVVMNQEVILAMDNHLIAKMKQPDFKPAKGYIEFCEQQVEILRREIARLKEQAVSSEIISEKIKKTYKNRYFILSNA